MTWDGNVGYTLGVRGAVTDGLLRCRRVLAWSSSAVAATVVISVTVVGASAATAGAATRVSAPALTLPSVGHGYRHGAIPRPTKLSRVDPALQSAAAQATNKPGQPIKGPLRYMNGSVVTGAPKVYLVFWGAWGAKSTNGSGYVTFADDPAGVAPELQAFFAGLGTDGELWSAVVTQYCQGVPVRASSCPPSAAHVAYPHNALAGVWEDQSAVLPTGTPGSASIPTISATRIAQEAADAATHFGDASTDAQFVVVSPTGTNPDGWLNPTSGFCAYHDSSGDPQLVGVTGPDVAYTNLPYLPDISASSCSSLASPSPLDAVSETASHEYAEVLTDPFPASGWLDLRGNEIADKCAYLSAGQPGQAIDLTLATGTFDVQGLWADDASKKGGCETSHATVFLGGLAKREKAVVGTAVSVQVGALDVLGRALSFSASRLPAGLGIDPSSGLITGTPSARGRTVVTITASDGTSSTSTTVKWMVRR